MNTFVPVFFLNEDTKLGIGRVNDRTDEVHCHPFEQYESRICIERLFDTGLGLVHGYDLEVGSYMAWDTRNLMAIHY